MESREVDSTATRLLGLLLLVAGIMAARGGNKLIKLGWIGAGGINFGSLEGPWNHAVRMQKQKNVQFTAVVDPNISFAQVSSECILLARRL